MKHDEQCEINRFEWAYCQCAERAYAASCTEDELKDFSRNTGWGRNGRGGAA